MTGTAHNSICSLCQALERQTVRQLFLYLLPLLNEFFENQWIDVGVCGGTYCAGPLGKKGWCFSIQNGRMCNTVFAFNIFIKTLLCDLPIFEP